MTVVTTRPNATVSSSGFANTGGGSRHGATSDDSDSTYILGSPVDYVYLGCAEPSIPAGGLVKALSVRVRSAKSSVGTPRVLVILYPDGTDGPHLDANLDVSWGIATTTTPVTGAFSTTPTDAVVCLIAATGEAYLHEVYVDTTYVGKPVTVPSAPTGTVTTSNAPTVEWANTLDSDGGAQTHFQVRVFTDAQYGAGGFDPATSTATWDSGDTASSATSAQITTPLADDTYRAYVRVAQTVNGATHWSDYAYTGFTIDVDLPAAPDTPTLTVQTGRIKIDVEGNAGTATTSYLEVQRSEDAGTTWEALRLTTEDGLLAGTSGTAYDYEAPNGTLMSYRVRAAHDYSGQLAYSAWSSTATATWTDSAWWLKCPEQPALNMTVNVTSFQGYQRAARQGVFQPLGATEQIVVSDTRGGATGSLTVRLDTAAERADLDALVDANLTLLLQGPAAHDEPDHYLRVGDHERKRVVDHGGVTKRVDTLTWLEVAAPSGVVYGWAA